MLKKALIIGSGSIGRRHAENIHKLYPDIEFLLLRRTASHSSLAKDLDAGVVGSMEVALSWAPDFAIVSSPSSKHFQDLIPLLEKGIPFYVEKPVVTNREELDQLKAIQVTGCPISMSGCNLRFLPSLRVLRELIQDGVIGNVVRASLQAGQWLPDWRPQQDYRKSYSADPVLGGGVLFDLVHELDIARFLFGEFSRVLAFAGKYSSLDIVTEDTACVILQAEHCNMLVSVNLDYVSRLPRRTYEIVGDKGSLCWDLQANKLELSRPQGCELIACGENAFNVSNTYIAAMKEFLEAVGHGVDTSQNLSEGIRSAELVINAREAAGL